MTTHSSIPAWKIPWTEESGGLCPQARKESDMTEATQHALIIMTSTQNESFFFSEYLENYLGNILAAIFKDEYSQKCLITLPLGFHLSR